MSATLRSCVRALTDAIARAGAAPVTHVELTREDAIAVQGRRRVAVRRAPPADETDAAFVDARALAFAVLAPGGTARSTRVALAEPTRGADLIGRLNTLLAVSE